MDTKGTQERQIKIGPEEPLLEQANETPCCCCAAGRVTIGDSTSLLTTYRATVNVVTAKINPTLVYNDPPTHQG